MIKQSKWDTRISENWTEVFSKKIRETFKEECQKMENWDQDDQLLPKTSSQNQMKKFQKSNKKLRKYD